ncbi:MAG TPA: type VII secretion protein EccE [Mycobacterium sp.]
MTRLTVLGGVLAVGLLGWSVAGYPGAAAGLILGLAGGAIRWRHRQLWSWLALWVRRRQPIVLGEPVTVTNDRSGGGVRYQDGIVTVAVQLLGKPHLPTLFTGSASAETENAADVVGLLPLLRQSMGLVVSSLSLVSAGSRRRSTGDYARVYDTLIGTPPYAGQRETWLIARIPVLANADALRWRSSMGTAALAAAQRISAALRQQGIRARVATATDIVEMERRLAGPGLDPRNRRWRSVRGETGWLTTYGYRPADISADKLAQAWSMQVDGIVQNVTLFPERTAGGRRVGTAGGMAVATVTVRTAQPPSAPPGVLLQPLPGEQALGLAANLCCPLPDLRGVSAGALPETLTVPIGPSGVLLGKVGAGNRLMLPLDDPGEFSRVHVAAEDYLAKRLVVRLAGSGERVTVHTRDPQRWASVRMPDVVVTGSARPAPGTTVSVVDGTCAPAPRPGTVISVGAPRTAQPRAVDVLITQTGPAALEVTTRTQVHAVEMELFRAENRYVSSEAGNPAATIKSGTPELEPAD